MSPKENQGRTEEWMSQGHSYVLIVVIKSVVINKIPFFALQKKNQECHILPVLICERELCHYGPFQRRVIKNPESSRNLSLHHRRKLNLALLVGGNNRLSDAGKHTPLRFHVHVEPLPEKEEQNGA